MIPVVFTSNLQYMKVFSSFKDVKVIQFSSMQDAFTGFSDKARTTLLISFEVPLLYLWQKKWIDIHVYHVLSHSYFYQEREDKFRNRVKRYVGIWCCVFDHTPGHIYYDMYWDEKPEWKPLPPQTSADDHPPWWGQLQVYVCFNTKDRRYKEEISLKGDLVSNSFPRPRLITEVRNVHIDDASC